MNKNQLHALFATVFLLISIPFSVFAVKSAIHPTRTAGGYYRSIVDRVEISVSATEFTLRKTTDLAEPAEITFTLTAEKCEPDFYALIDNIEVTDLPDANAQFLCISPGAESALPRALPLPVIDGKSAPLVWEVTISASLSSRGDYTANLRVEYTAGITKETADSHLLQIPLVIHVQ